MMRLSKPQRLIYDMEKFVGGSISVICGSMLLSGNVDIRKLEQTINELYRLNDALRIRISESGGEVSQTISDYVPKKIDVLRFDDKTSLDAYADNYAKEPLDFYGELCEFKIVVMPERYGILVKIHHIIGDAWTLSLIGNQLNALLRGETPEAYSYADYLESEDAYAQSKRYEKDKVSFLEQFKKCDEATYLSEKPSNGYTASRKTFVLERDKAAAVKDYARNKEASVFTLFTAALAVYMTRVKMNAERFYIGTAVLNRGSNKEKNTMGMFINTVPMLIELDNQKSFAENLSEVESTTLSALRHQKYNYGDVLADLRKEYGFSEKLYDVIISYQNATVVGDDIETTWYHSCCQTESLQIHIDDRENAGFFRIHYDYLTKKFTAHEIEMLHERITNLLFSAIENDEKMIYELDFLTKEEQQKLLYDFNNTAIDYPRDKCVHTLFEEQVLLLPDKVAVIASDKTLTYRELNEESNKIAHSLIEKGVQVGDIVAFRLPRRSYLIAVIFGILKAGAAYLPIDPDYPPERIDYMLSDSGTKICFTESNVADFLNNKDLTSPELSFTNDRICYCIYTSGSTGNPKGTLLTHRNVVNYVHDNKNNVIPRIVKNDFETILSVTTVGFDIFVTESIMPLTNGLTVVFADEDQTRLQAELNQLFEWHPADVIQTTPTKMNSLIADASNVRYLKQLRAIILGGEALDGALVDKLQKLTDAEIYNIYGPTEATVWVSSAPIKNSTDITIGKPIANTQIYIVDPHMNIVPIGVTGELCIAGDCIGAGYLNRPELTAEKFIDNPFGIGKLYKTGDLAYWREDGNIVYVGRNDFQVKLRGLRIELGEIESAISSIVGISQSVVIVRKNNEGRQLICAFYTGKETEPKEIRAQIGKKLPKYMLPHIITHIDEMPLTPSGKINRKALPEVDLNSVDTSVEYVAPTTDREKVIIRAISQVLGNETISILDNFFDLGGDSLKAIELTSVLEEAGYGVEIKTIFDSVDIKALAEKLTQKEISRTQKVYGGVIPATSAQMRVYTAQSLNADSALYNVPYVFRAESVDIPRLQAAVDRLIARHESLRTHFENRNGHIMQVIDDFASVKVEVLFSSSIADFIRPFDLTASPLLRVGVYENTVMFDLHHIIADGGTMPVFFRELNELYMGRELKETPVQYGEFAVTPVDTENDERYWLSVFDGEFPVLEMNTDFPRTEKQSFVGAAEYSKISGELHNKIKEKCKELNITPFVFYMAGFSVLLSKFSNNEDIVIGMPVSGRSPKFLNTFGMFVNTVALRTKPEGEKSAEMFLREIRELSVAAIAHQNYPFGELVKKIHAETPGRNPLFDVMFAYQSEEMSNIVFGDQKAGLLPVPVNSSKCDLTFNVLPREKDVVLMVEYCTSLYKEQTIQRFIGGFRQILTQMLSDGELKNFSAVLLEEKQKLLFDFNDTAVDYPRDKCVHQLFEEQAEKTPDKVAVIACDKTLTYKELNGEANRIAHALMEKGVGVGDIVAFALPRKSYLISTILGILKSGAAYLPIDPDYPEERIEYMLSDSRAKLCITEENIAGFSNGSVENPNIAVSSERICYCIYTSGSTGKPKCVLIPHYCAVNFLQNNDKNSFQSALIEKCETVIAANSIAFDITLQEILLPLLNARQVYLLSNSEAAEAAIADRGMHLLNCGMIATPTKFSLFMKRLSFCLSLKNYNVIMCGAEPFPPSLLHDIRKYSAAAVFNGYGPTETTCGVAYSEIEDSAEITIGKPIANTQIYIVDPHMNIVPIGVTGELCIAGDGVGAGYLNRPELTAEKFIDNPFGKGKLYKTGDLAYWREDGNIVYVGRNDFQVKIRGLRIELGEIENALSAVDGVTQSVVIVRKDDHGRQLICAFYTGDELEAKSIRSAIGSKLPKYMLPHIITHIDEMPLTSSGKINRKALPEVDLNRIESETEYVAPVTEREKTIAKIFADVLEVERIGLEDDFFELGCDSLKAIEFISDCHYEGIYFNLQSVFDHPTISSLLKAVDSANRDLMQYDRSDFEKINRLIAGNRVNHIPAPTQTPVGNLLLTGATGFLGAHILADYLAHDTGTAYCIIRGKNAEDSKRRLDETLRFYFGDTYADDNRIVVLCGDLTKEHLGLSEEDYHNLFANVDTVINSVANVKHYGSYEFFYEVNVKTAVRLIDFCKAADAKLIHISTTSVAGNDFDNQFSFTNDANETFFTEHDLYIGQPLDNVYVRSKFEAEKAVLEAMGEGLKANIMRMGNLTNRRSDGKFQKNHKSNAFLNRIKATVELGCIPDYLLELYSEFTPIDDAAAAVMTITRHFRNDKNVFHVENTNPISFSEMFDYMSILGMNMKIVSGDVFGEMLRQTENDPATKHIYETFINDLGKDNRLSYDSPIKIDTTFSNAYLRSLGFVWHKTDLEYLLKYFDYFKGIGYIGGEPDEE